MVICRGDGDEMAIRLESHLDASSRKCVFRIHVIAAEMGLKNTVFLS